MLRAYKAVLLVDQRYEMEPELAEALKRAKDAGVSVFYDDTCRKELVQAYAPLGAGFTHFDDGFGANHMDIAYKLLPERLAETLPALRQKLSPVAPPPAELENPEVYLSQRQSGAGRFLFVVNNSAIPLDYGQLCSLLRELVGA